MNQYTRFYKTILKSGGQDATLPNLAYYFTAGRFVCSKVGSYVPGLYSLAQLIAGSPYCGLKIDGQIAGCLTKLANDPTSGKAIILTAGPQEALEFNLPSLLSIQFHISNAQLYSTIMVGTVEIEDELPAWIIQISGLTQLFANLLRVKVPIWGCRLNIGKAEILPGQNNIRTSFDMFELSLPQLGNFAAYRDWAKSLLDVHLSTEVLETEYQIKEIDDD